MQAAYLVGVSDPNSSAGQKGLVDPAQFARANQSIQMACQNLVDPACTQSQVEPDPWRVRGVWRPHPGVCVLQVLSAATIVAKHTSALCNACRLASSRTSNPVAKRQFVQSAKEVANTTANLVKSIKVRPQGWSPSQVQPSPCPLSPGPPAGPGWSLQPGEPGPLPRRHRTAHRSRGQPDGLRLQPRVRQHPRPHQPGGTYTHTHRNQTPIQPQTSTQTSAQTPTPPPRPHLQPLTAPFLPSQGYTAMEPILAAATTMLESSTGLIQTARSLAVNPKDPPKWSVLAGHSRTVSDSIKKLITNMR